jgi:Xaa-Pro aminopeptidase
MYQAVLESQLGSLLMLRAGVAAREVDAEARRILRSHRLQPYFRHSLGHGLGLQIHEQPRLAPTSSDILRDGQIVTVEPGVYVPGVGGVRIEDDVVVRPHGRDLLTSLPKDLLVL